MYIRLVNHVRLNGEIVVNEFRRKGAIGQNPANFGGSEKYILRLGVSKEFHHLFMVSEIQIITCPAQEVLIAASFQHTRNGGSDHAEMSRNVNACVPVHSRKDTKRPPSTVVP